MSDDDTLRYRPGTQLRRTVVLTILSYDEEQDMYLCRDDKENHMLIDDDMLADFTVMPDA